MIMVAKQLSNIIGCLSYILSGKQSQGKDALGRWLDKFYCKKIG